MHLLFYYLTFTDVLNAESYIKSPGVQTLLELNFVKALPWVIMLLAITFIRCPGVLGSVPTQWKSTRSSSLKEAAAWVRHGAYTVHNTEVKAIKVQAYVSPSSLVKYMLIHTVISYTLLKTTKHLLIKR